MHGRIKDPRRPPRHNTPGLEAYARRNLGHVHHSLPYDQGRRQGLASGVEKLRAEQAEFFKTHFHRATICNATFARYF